MLIDALCENYLDGEFLDANDSRANENNKIFSIHNLTKFIDLFNFYPIKVFKLRRKNDSNELTYVMNSGAYGTKNDRGETISAPKPVVKSDEEKYLLRLLALVSDKIKERFVNIQQCFRFLDANHS